MPRALDRRSAALLLIVALVLGTWWRVRGLADMPFYGDEYHGLRAARFDFAVVFRNFDMYGTHIMLPLLQRVTALLFEPSIITFRLPALIPGLLCLLFCYPAARSFVGRAPALVATIALCASPIHIYYSRFGRAYSLNILLGMLLVWAVRSAHLAEWRGKWRLLAVGLVAMLLPFTHLSSAGLALGVGLAGIGMAGRTHGRGAALRCLGVFAGAAIAAGLLFLPVYEPLIAYLTKLPPEEKARPEGLFGIANLLAGGAYAGVVWLVGLPVGLLLFARRSPVDAVVLGASIVGPALFLAVTLPHGMEYAYARYLVISLPSMLMILAWLLARPFESWLPGAAGPRVAVVVGLVLVTVGHLAGPLSPRAPDPGPFGNTYLAMRDLPAFDRRFPATPAIYKTIAEDPEVTRIIEAPALHSRAVLLYRNYYLQHGKQVLIGLARTPDDVRLNGPYAFIGDPLVGRKTGAQYLILHKTVKIEVSGFWSWVYSRSWPKSENFWDRGFMSRHRTFFIPEADTSGMGEELETALRLQLGPPVFEDQLVAAWRLRTARRGE